MIEALISQIQPIIVEYGAIGVFFATLLEQIIAPIPSSIIPLAAGFLLLQTNYTFLQIMWPGLFVIALPIAIGTTIGSLAVYGLGYWGGKPAIEKSKKWLGFSWDDLEKAERKFIRGKNDEIVLFGLRVLPFFPVMAISVFCGIIRYPIKTFAVITFLGIFVRSFGLSILGWHTGAIYTIHSETILAVEEYIFLALIIVVAFFLAYFKFFRKNSSTFS